MSMLHNQGKIRPGDASLLLFSKHRVYLQRGYVCWVCEEGGWVRKSKRIEKEEQFNILVLFCFNSHNLLTHVRILKKELSSELRKCDTGLC